MKAFENILIVGLGLIGGSIAKKLKDISHSSQVYGFDKNPGVLQSAKEQNLILNDNDLNLKDLNDLLVVFCIPVLSFRDALELASPLLPNENIIFTDTLSTKAEVFQILESDYQGVLSKFILSHPIAGSEKSSIEFSNKQLFDEKVTVVSPHQYNSQEDVDRVINFWSQLGSTTKLLSYQEHDLIFSKTSHLPHVISYALTESLFSSLNDQTFTFSGGSLEDYTRIASSDPLMWKDILISNNENIINSINEFEKSLSSLKELITNKDEEALVKFLSKIKTLRDNSVANN